MIDNHAQWFVCVPGALNLVQGPATYAALLRMGLPTEQVALAGHWAPRALVECAAADCKRRIARIAHAESSRAQPLMLLVPAGGAGAQGALLAAFTREVSKPVQVPSCAATNIGSDICPGQKKMSITVVGFILVPARYFEVLHY